MNDRFKRIGCGIAAGILCFSAPGALAESRRTGDLNGDGVINSADQRLLLRAMSTLSFSEAADLNGDGVLDMADADLLWRLSLQGALPPISPDPTDPTETAAPSGKPTDASSSAVTTTTKKTTSSATTKPTSSATKKPTATTAKPTTTTTTAKPTTTTTKKPTTTTTTAPTPQTAAPQVRPTLPSVTTPLYTPSVNAFTGRDRNYTLSVKNVNTGKIYDNKSKENLQLMLTYIVKVEMGQATFATYSTEAWKAQAVAAYTHLLYSYSDRTYEIYGHSDVDLSHPNDKKIYDAVGDVLGVKILVNGQSPICAYYSGSTAGTTRDNQTGWGLSYIQPVFSPESIALCQKYGYTKFITTHQVTLAELLSKMSTKLGATVQAESKSGLYPLYARSWIGAYVAETNLYYTKNGVKTYVTGRQLRETMKWNSASFVVTAQSNDLLTVTVQGHGHGMGFSQVGAAIFANEYGWNYRQILAHYYGMSASTTHRLYGPNW